MELSAWILYRKTDEYERIWKEAAKNAEKLNKIAFS
jgi:hypothetical protein